MRPEIIRKMIHMLFSIVMYLPLQISYFIKIDPVQFYAVVVAIVTWIYALKVKGPPPGIDLDEMRRKLRESGEQFKIIDKAISSVEQLIGDIERDYEKKSGWIGLLSGAIGISVSYILFGDLFIVGILALAVLDGIAAIVGISYGKNRIPFSHGTLEGTLSGALSYFLSLLLITSPLNAAIITITASIAELYGIEDNITVPITATATNFILLRLI